MVWDLHGKPRPFRIADASCEDALHVRKGFAHLILGLQITNKKAPVFKNKGFLKK
jgi:hypothetical protein